MGLNVTLDEAAVRLPVSFDNLTNYLGQPLETFWRRNNLGWDGHLNRNGNRQLALALARVLRARGIIPRDSAVPTGSAEILDIQFRCGEGPCGPIRFRSIGLEPVAEDLLNSGSIEARLR